MTVRRLDYRELRKVRKDAVKMVEYFNLGRYHQGKQKCKSGVEDLRLRKCVAKNIISAVIT